MSTPIAMGVGSVLTLVAVAVLLYVGLWLAMRSIS